MGERPLQQLPVGEEGAAALCDDRDGKQRQQHESDQAPQRGGTGPCGDMVTVHTLLDDHVPAIVPHSPNRGEHGEHHS